MKKLVLALTAAMALSASIVPPAPAAAPPPAGDVQTLDYVSGAWLFYRSRFLTDDGRIVDDANGNVSHSEGQGTGLILAAAADAQSDFDRIWAWTKDNLMVRPDGLASWKWDPEADPHVADPNNATDGDLLIAWGLLRAYKQWGDTKYFEGARTIAEAIAKNAIEVKGADTLLLPGAEGFGSEDREDGPIVNLSYWVFPAIDDLAVFAPNFPAKALIATGLSLLDRAQFGPAKLPADWMSLAGEEAVPAESFTPTFGYDAIRIPLYLAWYRAAGSRLLEPYATRWVRASGPTLSVVDLESGKPIASLTDAGYLAIADLVLCSLDRHPSGNPTQNFDLTHYYPSMLDMLSLLAMVERYPRCLTAS